MKRRSTLSERIYGALLGLYPRRFRLRFRGEMEQFFHDCYAGAVFSTWMRAIEDLVFSVPREWRREIIREDTEIDFHGLIDSVIVAGVVGSLLLGWGWCAALATLDIYALNFWNPGTTLVLAVVTFGMATLIGTLSAIFVARYRSAERVRIKV